MHLRRFWLLKNSFLTYGVWSQRLNLIFQSVIFLLLESRQFMLFVQCIEWHFIKWEWAKKTCGNVEICETYEFLMDCTCWMCVYLWTFNGSNEFQVLTLLLLWEMIYDVINFQFLFYLGTLFCDSNLKLFVEQKEGMDHISQGES